MFFSRKNAILLGGLIGTALYLAFFFRYFSPEESVYKFLSSAPLNERGDFLSGLFSPLAFFWLILGYFIQSIELGMQREELSRQMEFSKYQLELEIRKQDPEFDIELVDSEITIKNITPVLAKKIYVIYVHHESRSKTIIDMVSRLSQGGYITSKLDDWMPLPIYSEGESELLIIYDTQMDDMRSQRFNFINTNNSSKELIAWQIGTADAPPEYFTVYE